MGCYIGDICAYSAVQSQTAVTAYFTKQLLPFAFAEQYWCIWNVINITNVR